MSQTPTELAKAYDPSELEQKWATYWTEEKLFNTPDSTENGQSFTMLLPPPNVTGRLHMGHMLNQTEMDILTRWHRMLGDRTLWLPGTDHASIATQMMVERQIAAEGTTTREAMGRDAFIDKAWTWKHEYGSAITTQMRRLGASVDWSREYFTMDPNLSAAVNEAFIRLYEQGLIYRGTYIVNWDPQAQTAVSDLEVDSEERPGFLYHITYLLADGTGSITIATTRPETLLGDVAVAVNPQDERYTALIGKLLTLPLSAAAGNPDRTIPILADDWAQPEFGTGAVKVTPAHDPNDFAIGQRHNLPSLTILTKTAKIDLPGSRYHGLDRFEARKQILRDLESEGLLVKQEPHTIATPISQRTGAVIEPRLSDQWFVAVNKTPADGGPTIAQKSVAAVKEGHIKFVPDMYRTVYENWMDNIYDWCISRQLWWGQRIPAWYCPDHHITVARETPTACTTCLSTQLTQDPDVLDTWFSSGLLPITLFGWPHSLTTNHQSLTTSFYPTDLLVTGFDILFFWVARMIMLSTHFTLGTPDASGTPRTLAESVPFRNVYIHGLIRDANREKMSKTKGNVIDPLDIIGRFGTDAVRFTLASMASPGTDIAFSEARTEGNRAFANKIWNTARFVFMNLDRWTETNPGAQGLASATWASTSPNLPLESRWILTRLAQTAEQTNKSLTTYRFDEAAAALYQFFWGDLCDWYLEIIKLRLNFEDPTQSEQTAQSLHALSHVFESSLRLLSPFMPFITEEIWHALNTRLPVIDSTPKSIALTRFPQAADFPQDPAAAETIELLQLIITTTRALRKDLEVPEKQPTPIRIFSSTGLGDLAAAHSNILARLARVSSVEIASQPLTGPTARSTAAFDLELIYERQIDVPAERERLTKDLAKYEKGIQAADRQLTNEAFMAKAPAHIIETLRKQSTELHALHQKTKAALDSLPPA